MSRAASNLQINSARLWDAIHETAKFGATPKGGVRRLTLSAEDKQVRDWFRRACEAAGLEVHVDALGSMFGAAQGTRHVEAADRARLASRYPTDRRASIDGVLGTLAALEVVRTLNDAGIETETPICICNWTNEEGSRFAPAMMASAAYVGDFTTDNILARKDAEGVTVGEALDSIGYRGDTPVGTQKFSGFVELHIEQGPILEAEHKTIGVVDSGQGVLWYDGKITGFESHAGSTPMPLRRDALATLVGNRAGDGEHRQQAWPERGRHRRRSRDRKALAQRHPRRDRVHHGLPQRRRRDHGRARQGFARGDCGDRREAQGRGHGRAGLAQAADPFQSEVRGRRRECRRRCSAIHTGRITSGAGHDACNLNTVMPAAMVFVPCKDGVSHNELEDATQADCAAGANVLMHTVLALAGVAS